MKKYRPYLTIEELKRLASLSSQDSQIHPTTLYLTRYIQDIDSGWRKPNTVTSPMVEKLGFVTDPRTGYEATQQLRYLSGDMSPTEEKEYETQQGRTV